MAVPLLPNLLILFAIATGIVVTEPPLRTDRVHRYDAQHGSGGDHPSHHSYFWEDPLACAPKPTSKPPDQDVPLLKGKIGAILDGPRGGLVLFVGLDGSAQPGAVERRLRTRIAIASALGGQASMLALPGSQRLAPCRIRADDAEIHLGATVEVFRELDFSRTRWFSIDRSWAAVVYVDEAKLAAALTGKDLAHSPPAPGPEVLAKLVQDAGLTAERQARTGCRIAYLGLTRSESLRGFLERTVDQTAELDESDRTAPAVSLTVYSPNATAEKALLHKDVIARSSAPDAAARLERMERPPGMTRGSAVSYAIATAEPPLRGELHRIGADDGALSAALVQELALRGIPLAPWKVEDPGVDADSAAPEQASDAVLLLADLDHYHSRLLIDSFRRSWQDCYHLGGKVTGYDLSADLVKRVRAVHYPEALDGPAAGTGSGAERPTTRSLLRADPGGKHVAEGGAQFDALRRLPAQIREFERADGVRFRAIGLFGSDVHDKLLLLGALKPEFPGAVFFTNDIDARLWQGTERSSSMNLVVAGAFGLSLDRELQGTVPPFRASYQTAAYLCCLDAIGFQISEGRPLPWPGPEVEIHEVSRSGDHLLGYWQSPEGASPMGTFVANAAGRPPVSDGSWGSARLQQQVLRLCLYLLLGLLLLHLWWPVLQARALHPEREPVSTGIKVATVLVSAVTVAAWAYALRLPSIASKGATEGEALDLFSGISGIPIATANLLVVAIGSAMMLRFYLLQRPSPPYPFPDRSRSTPGSLDPEPDASRPAGSAPAEAPDEEDASEPPGDLSHEPSRTWMRPSLRDPIGWIQALWHWIHLRSRTGGTLLSREFLDEAEKLQVGRRTRFLKRAPDSRLLATYGRELLATSGWNTLLRVIVMLLAGGLIFHLGLFPADQEVPAPPSIRGEAFRKIYDWSDMLAKLTLAFAAAFAFDRQLSIAIGLDKFYRLLSRDGDDEKLDSPYDWTKRPEIIPSERKLLENPRHPLGELGLWEMPLLRLAAQRFRAVSPLTVAPFILLFIMLVSRHSVFERTHLPLWEMILFAIFLTGPLLAGALAQRGMARVFDLVASRLRRASYVAHDSTDAADARANFFKSELAACEELSTRTRYGILGNPIVESILLPLGGVGILELSSSLATLVK